MTSIRDKKLGVKRGKMKGTHGKYGGPAVVPGSKPNPKLKGTATAKNKGPR